MSPAKFEGYECKEHQGDKRRCGWVGENMPTIEQYKILEMMEKQLS
jgi:hypothetical protein